MLKKINFNTFVKFLPQIIKNMPDDWTGTTFRNDHNYVGREKFVKNLFDLIAESVFNDNNKKVISCTDLESIGNAEDYLRVA
jgi:hypothetical protein